MGGARKQTEGFETIADKATPVRDTEELVAEQVLEIHPPSTPAIAARDATTAARAAGFAEFATPYFRLETSWRPHGSLLRNQAVDSSGDELSLLLAIDRVERYSFSERIAYESIVGDADRSDDDACRASVNQLPSTTLSASL
jgi:hypothetical protein